MGCLFFDEEYQSNCLTYHKRWSVFVEAVCSEESARTRILNWASESEIFYKIVFACANVFFLERIPKFLQTVKGVYDFPRSKCVESL